MNRRGPESLSMRSVLFVVGVLVVAAPLARAEEPDAGAVDAGAAELDAPSLPPIPEVDGGIAQIPLDQALQRALAQNPQVATAVAEYKRSEALVREARASWFPTLTGNAVYTRLDNNRTLNNNVIVGENSLAANLNLAVPVFAPRAWLNWGVAKENVGASQASAEDARRLVAVAVGRAYLTILAQHRILEADLRAVAAATAHRDFAKQRLEGGVGNRVDLVRAEQALQADVALAENARTALARAQEALGVLLAEDRPLDVTGDPNLPQPPTDRGQAQKDAKERRRDLEALMVRTQVAERVVHNDWADYMPAVTVAFQPFFQDPKTLTQPTTGWQATAALTWTLYDGGLRYGQQQERALLAQEAHLAQDAATRQAMADVRAALAAVEHADAALLGARNASKLAHEALELVTTAYRAGASTNIEVIDAERIALDAETQAAVAEDNARQARLDLLAASGRFP